jgi:hypothetical protein
MCLLVDLLITGMYRPDLSTIRDRKAKWKYTIS